MNEEASDKVLEVEQKYNELRRPVYEKRNEIIKSIPDFWIIAVSDLSCSHELFVSICFNITEFSSFMMNMTW